jgi:hypothetical protein
MNYLVRGIFTHFTDSGTINMLPAVCNGSQPGITADDDGVIGGPTVKLTYSDDLT